APRRAHRAAKRDGEPAPQPPAPAHRSGHGRGEHRLLGRHRLGRRHHRPRLGGGWGAARPLHLLPAPPPIPGPLVTTRRTPAEWEGTPFFREYDVRVEAAGEG